jgi:putative Holliday junction resolvase
MGFWLGIDHGTRRIGVALGSTANGIASPLEVVAAEPWDRAVARIRQLAEEYRAEGLVVGWPLNTDDTEGPQGVLVRQAACRLAEQTGLDVRLWDERLTSFAADQALAGAYTRKGKKARQDAVAAAEILRDFMACDGPTKAMRAAEAKATQEK